MCTVQRMFIHYMHSHKILMKQQGWPRGVSSVGNPRQALTGFNFFTRLTASVEPGSTCMIFLVKSPRV